MLVAPRRNWPAGVGKPDSKRPGVNPASATYQGSLVLFRHCPRSRRVKGPAPSELAEQKAGRGPKTRGLNSGARRARSLKFRLWSPTASMLLFPATDLYFLKIWAQILAPSSIYKAESVPILKDS